MVVAIPAMATTILHRTVPELGKQSSHVVLGQVVEVRSFWNDTHTKVFTETIIQVDETYKGARQQTIRLLQPGGTVDNMKVTVHGALQWRQGEEVLLFVEPYRDGAYGVSGFSQGKFKVERDATGAPFIHRDALEGVNLVGGAAPSSSGTDAHRSAVKRTPLEKFVTDALSGVEKGGAR